MAYTYTPQIGYGGKLQIDNGYPGGEDLVQVDGLDDFDISFDTSEIETTSRQGTTAGARNNATYLPGITRIEAHATFVGDPDAQALAGTPKIGGHGRTIYLWIGKLGKWIYTFADGSTWTFVGFMTRPVFNSPRDDKFTIDVSWRITGADTFVGDTD